jgi:RNA polymerase-binding transcription factor DksA
MMKREQLERYRTQLRTLLDRVEKTAAGLEEQVRSPTGGEAGGGISNAPLHLGDVGSEAYAQELGATLLENETYIRDEAAAGLDRISRGTYGRCERCGKDILLERLDAIPYARHCTPCAAKVQNGRAVNLNDGRPAEWLGKPGYEGANQAGAADRVVGRTLGSAPDDTFAAGTPGGGAATGGLAGTNVGGGSPRDAHLEAAMADGTADAPSDIEDEDQPEAFSGPSGGAVGGTPANKRARGGLVDPPTPKKQTAKKPTAKKQTTKKTRAKRTKE